MRAPCSAARVAWEDILLAAIDHRPTEAAVVDVVEMMERMELCRDDACGRCDPHAAHPVRAKRDRTVYDVDPLDDIVYSHVLERECRTAGQLYGYVVNDYGTVDYRTVQRSLARLSADHKVIAVLPRQIRRRIADPTDLCRPGGGGSGGAYVRWTSPLLWTPDGVQCLAAQVEDLIQDRSLCRGRSRRTSRTPAWEPSPESDPIPTSEPLTSCDP